jgi:hypothetical protein
MCVLPHGGGDASLSLTLERHTVEYLPHRRQAIVYVFSSGSALPFSPCSLDKRGNKDLIAINCMNICLYGLVFLFYRALNRHRDKKWNAMTPEVSLQQLIGGVWLWLLTRPTGARTLLHDDEGRGQPTPGLPVRVLDTKWRCRWVGKDTRASWSILIVQAVYSYNIARPFLAAVRVAQAHTIYYTSLAARRRRRLRLRYPLPLPQAPRPHLAAELADFAHARVSRRLPHARLLIMRRALRARAPRAQQQPRRLCVLVAALRIRVRALAAATVFLRRFRARTLACALRPREKALYRVPRRAVLFLLRILARFFVALIAGARFGCGDKEAPGCAVDLDARAEHAPRLVARDARLRMRDVG